MLIQQTYKSVVDVRPLITMSEHHHPRVAFVIGWEHERTVQYEGIAEIPPEAELAEVRAYYFDHFRDGPTEQTWPGLVYWRVRPTWIRYSDLNINPERAYRRPGYSVRE